MISVNGASWSSGLTRYHYDEAMQEVKVRIPALPLFFEAMPYVASRFVVKNLVKNLL